MVCLVTCQFSYALKSDDLWHLSICVHIVETILML